MEFLEEKCLLNKLNNKDKRPKKEKEVEKEDLAKLEETKNKKSELQIEGNERRAPIERNS